MMDRFLRLASILLVAAGLAACDDDTEAPTGETSTVNVSVYVEADDETGLTAGDTPISGASVELMAVEGGETRTATTGADGIATFTDVPAGVYTLTHTPNPPITDATLTSSEAQTVVAQFEGGTSTAAFVYSFNPGTISGQFFRDENDNDTFEEGTDVTLAGFQAILFAGADTIGTAVGTEIADETGTFVFEDLAPGAYTILVRPIIGSEVSDTTVAVTVAAGATTDVLIEFTGGEQITDIAEARALASGTVVTVQGVVTAGTNVFSSSSFYVQDPTGGIAVFIGGGGPSVDVALGDSLQITGTIGAFNNEVQIGGGSALSIEVLGTGDVPAPRVVTGSDVNAGLFQGELVEALAVTIDSLSDDAFGFNENLYVHDATGDFVVFIDGTTGIDSSYISFGSTYNITGIMTVFGTTFEIKPRSSEDLELTSNPGGTVPISIARLLADDQTATVEGVVIAGTGTYNSSTLYIQDNTAGILVFHGSGGTPFATGDSIRVAGTLDTFNGERELVNVTMTDLGTGTLPTPASITAAELNAGQRQGELVVADSVEVVSVSTSGSGNVTVVVTDDTGEFTIFGDVDTGLTAANFTVGSSYAVTGVAASFNDLRQIKPRSTADVTAL